MIVIGISPLRTPHPIHMFGKSSLLVAKNAELKDRPNVHTDAIAMQLRFSVTRLRYLRG